MAAEVLAVVVVLGVVVWARWRPRRTEGYRSPRWHITQSALRAASTEWHRAAAMLASFALSWRHTGRGEHGHPRASGALRRPVHWISAAFYRTCAHIQGRT